MRSIRHHLPRRINDAQLAHTAGVTGRRRLPFVVGLVGLLILATAAASYVLFARDRGEAGTVVQGVAASLAALAGAGWWLWERRKDEAGVANVALEPIAQTLGEQVRLQWERAAFERHLRYPAPIPVRWRWSGLAVTSSPEDAAGEGSEWHRFAPLPGMDPVTSASLSKGGLTDLLAVYGGLDSGRLVILGRAGMGKTAAAIVLVLDALAHRAGLADEARGGVPIPVLVGLHGWDARSQPLTSWLEQRLVADYPFLKERSNGMTAAGRLLAAGLIAPILDGLDEMPEDLRSVGLRAVDEQATCRLVMLSRSDEMVAAVAEGHLNGAAALELLPIDPGTAADYLARCQVRPLPPSWQAMVESLRRQPGTALATALDTPLMLTLVRDTYRGRDPVHELLDIARFPRRQDIEDHLLDRVIPAAYAPRPGEPEPRYTVAQAQRWFAYIAYHLVSEGTTDLGWWRMPAWKSAWPRICFLGLLFGTAGAIGFQQAIPELVEAVTQREVEEPLIAGAPVVLAFVVLATLWATRSAEREVLRRASPMRIGRLSWQRVLSRRAVSFGLTAFLAATVIASVLTRDVVTGLAFGTLNGVLWGLGDALSYQVAPVGAPVVPLTAWRDDVRYKVLASAVFGIELGLATGLLFGVWSGIAFLIFGTTASDDAACSPAALAFVQMRRADEGPLRMIRFLEDARDRSVLRTAGPVYQFRHIRLQNRLVRGFAEAIATGPKTPL
jgi:hypothetical protein